MHVLVETSTCIYVACYSHQGISTYVLLFYSFQFLHQLSKLVCIATQGNFLAIKCRTAERLIDSYLNSEWLLKYIFRVYYTKKSTCLCLTQCNFVTSSDFIKSIHQSLKQSPLISAMP